MKAVVLTDTGGPEKLEVREVDPPRATPGHVVVKVHACGVCYRDVIDRRGGFGFIQTPISPGHEFAGEVVEVGEGVRAWRVGDRVISMHRNVCGACPHCTGGDERLCTAGLEVYGLTVNGGYAEYVLAGEHSMVPLPEDIPFDVASTVMCTSGVALHNVRNRARLGLGERVLITGATGGVGAQAVQIAKLAGAVVWAVTSSEEKVERLEALGADHVVVSPDGKFHKQIRQETAGEGMDAAIDCVGGATFNSSLRSLRRGGRVVVIGNIQGEPVGVNLGLLVVNGYEIRGADTVRRQDVRDAIRLVQAGRLQPLISQRMPLEDAAEAHRTLESRGAFGRIVLTTS